MTLANNDKGVIFDLDGVLVDTGKYHKASWYDLAEKEGFTLTDTFFADTFGMQNYQIIPMLVGPDVTPEEVTRLSDWKEQRYRDLIKGELEFLPGVIELLKDLKANNFLTAIGTSTPKANLDFMLDETGGHEYFTALTWAEDVKNGKPAPDTFLKAAEKIGLAPERCVVVEDAIAGVQAGKSAGMKVIAITSTRKREELTQAELIIDSMNEINAEAFAKLLA